jgi:hypothetical protein
MGFSIVVNYSPSKKERGRRNTDELFQGLAVLTGSPIAGALIERDNGKFIGLQLFSATSMVAAAAVLLLVRWVTVGWRREKL